MAKDYYNILGVEKNASKDDLKKAFHKLAHKYHPDKKGGDEAKFKEVNEAYQVLSDDAKRANYDATGSAEGNPFQGGYGQGGGFGGGGFQADFDFGNMNDIFSDFFGGGRPRQQERRGRDISTELRIPFEEAVFGVEHKIIINKISTCDICHGHGAKPGTKMKKCATCNGQGKVQRVQKSFLGSYASIENCPECGGTGNIPEEKCPNCKGTGVFKKDQEITVKIPAGINNGESLRLAGMGEAISRGTPGDLYIKMHVSPHPLFKRQGNDLVMDLSIKLTDALLGAEYPIKTLDGTITLRIPEGVTHGEILRIRGKGVPARGGRGDILVTIKVQIPKKLSRSAKESIEMLKKEGL